MEAFLRAVSGKINKIITFLRADVEIRGQIFSPKRF